MNVFYRKLSSPSIRIMMLVVLVVCCLLGWLVNSATLQSSTVNRIRSAGGNVMYEWQFRDGKMIMGESPRGPRWLNSFVGLDYFNFVSKIDVGSKISDEDITNICRLSRLNTLSIDISKASDKVFHSFDNIKSLRWLTIATPRNVRIQLKRLTELQISSNLQGLELGDTDLGNSDLSLLENLRNLELLGLHGTGISDDGIPAIKKLGSLKVLDIGNTKMTSSGINKIKQAMPNLIVLQ